MPAPISLIGKQFGKLTVIAEAPPRRTPAGHRVLRVSCICECGRTVVVCNKELRRGDTKSCGCSTHPIKHGHAKRGARTKIYAVWHAMVQRCDNREHIEWSNYGGRGIRVCNHWLEFSNFFRDMGHCPKGHMLDRNDNDGPYCKNNCQWSTPAQSARNRRTNRVFTILGITGCLTDLAIHFRIKPQSVASRLRYGYTPEEAFTAPPNLHIRKLRLQSQAMAQLKAQSHAVAQTPLL